MYTDFFKTFTTQTEKTFEPYYKFSKMMTKNVEDLTELQLKSMKAYSNIGLSQMKAASDVKDVASFTAFNTHQLGALSQLSQQLLDDSNQFQSIAKEFKEEVEKLASESMSAVTPA